MTTENNKKESEVLKPCPFCGGEATIEQNRKNGYKIGCKACVIYNESKVLYKSMEWLRAKMIENWNTRFPATPPPIEGEIKSKEYVLNENVDNGFIASCGMHLRDSILAAMQAYAGQFTASKEKEYREALEGLYNYTKNHKDLVGFIKFEYLKKKAEEALNK